jgi:hypothetical protein
MKAETWICQAIEGNPLYGIFSANSWLTLLNEQEHEVYYDKIPGMCERLLSQSLPKYSIS